MNAIFFGSTEWNNLLPLTYTRPVSELRMGIWTFKERWQQLFPDFQFSDDVPSYLRKKFPLAEQEHSLYINPSFFPSSDWKNIVKSIELGMAYFCNNQLVLGYLSPDDYKQEKYRVKKDIKPLFKINYPWDLFTYNALAIDFDFSMVKQNKKSELLLNSNRIIGSSELIFVEKNVIAECAIFNTRTGPIYLGENAQVMEGSMIRGSMALGENSIINMGSKIYGGTTFGPYVKVGGEVNNSIIIGYSNKGHEGFLGNSVIGEWCNLGADTNTSNMKNNYGDIDCWSFAHKKYIDTGLQFCGLTMGDHSKSAINTQFNTGTMVGICANIFESGFPPKNIPNFSWGGGKSHKFDLDKAYEVAEKAMMRRGKSLLEEDKDILSQIFNLSLIDNN